LSSTVPSGTKFPTTTHDERGPVEEVHRRNPQAVVEVDVHSAVEGTIGEVELRGDVESPGRSRCGGGQLGADRERKLQTEHHESAAQPDAEFLYADTGLAEGIQLAGYARDDDPPVRPAVADALRKTQNPVAEKTLLALVADTDSSVQDRALHTLTRYELAPGHLDTLRQEVASGRLQSNDFGMLMTLLERNRHSRPPSCRCSRHYATGRSPIPAWSSESRR
jgi:hypothetical protein